MKIEVARASDDELEACYEIRRVVFVVEQGVARDEEFDDIESDCVHFIARRGGRAVGTARLHPQLESAKAQRVAVLESERRHGIGAELMRAIESEACERNLREVVLHAQTIAIPFYEAIGYAAEGPVFMEANIPHRLMRKRLSPAD